MIYVQSRSQNIFNRFYTGFCKYYFFALPVLIGSIYRGEYISDVFYYLITLIIFLILLTSWLVIFNRGDEKIIEYGLEITHHQVCFIKYGEKECIAWSDFIGFSIENNLARSVILKTINGKNIEFGYYTFSSKQRRAIFNRLSKSSAK